MARAKSGSAEAAENLRKQVKATTAFQPHLRTGEPDWDQTVKHLNLSPDSCSALVASLRRAWLLPFDDVPVLTGILLFQYARLPTIRDGMATQAQGEGLRLCTLFDLLVSMSLQGFSPGWRLPPGGKYVRVLTRQGLRPARRNISNLHGRGCYFAHHGGGTR